MFNTAEIGRAVDLCEQAFEMRETIREASDKDGAEYTFSEAKKLDDEAAEILSKELPSLAITRSYTAIDFHEKLARG